MQRDVHTQPRTPHQEPLSWRTLLAQLLKNREERERLIATLRVSERTLARWTQEDYPVPARKRALLLAALPDSQRRTFADLMRKDIPQPTLQDLSDALPSDYRPLFDDLVRQAKSHERTPERSASGFSAILYRIAVDAACRTAKEFRRESVTYLCSVHVSASLDPEQHGLLLLCLICQSGSDGFVRSLKEVSRQGEGQWQQKMKTQPIMYGSESLAGQALSSRKMILVRHAPLLIEGAQSGIALPIQRPGTVAGALVAYSVNPDHFEDQQRQDLLKEYSQLLAVTAFEERDFYPPERIMLDHVFPSPQVQEQIILRSSHLVAAFQRCGMTQQEAEAKVFQLLEEALPFQDE